MENNGRFCYLIKNGNAMLGYVRYLLSDSLQKVNKLETQIPGAVVKYRLILVVFLSLYICSLNFGSIVLLLHLSNFTEYFALYRYHSLFQCLSSHVSCSTLLEICDVRLPFVYTCTFTYIQIRHVYRSCIWWYMF